jgi:competence protein ComEC
MAFTAGIVYDRFRSPAFFACVLLAFVSLAAWGIVFLTNRRPGLAACYLLLTCAPLGAAYHHYRRDVGPTNTLADLTGEKPVAVQLRGFLDEEPTAIAHEAKQPLRSRAQEQTWRSVLQATQSLRDGEWSACSDRVLVYVQGDAPAVHVGDEVEISGRLSALKGPKNPGEVDSQEYYRYQCVYTQVSVRGQPYGVIRLEQHWPESYHGYLAFIRGWGHRTLTEAIPDKVLAGSAVALVLGEDSEVTPETWGRYKRTGVIHVLVISGQHLVLLAVVLLWILPRLGCRLGLTFWIVGLFLVFYVLLTGPKLPGVRSAVVTCAGYGGWILRRRIVPANLLALAWLVVALHNPVDIFSPGCQLSFLSVLILYRIAFHWMQQERDALDRQDSQGLNRVLLQSQPIWLRWLRGYWWAIKATYKITLLVWLGVTPLVAWHYHTVPLVALLLLPPLSMLTSIALLAGFVLLAMAALHLPVLWLCALPLRFSLGACDFLVDWADRQWWSHIYVPDLPVWWLIGYYAGILAFLTLAGLRNFWRPTLLVGIGWLCLGLLLALVRIPTGEFRCTFLAVGHGGCAVIETPDGRVLLYDAGAIAGEQVAERQIAPFLWQRGIRRIDEVLLSHADLDHFNGLPPLLARFPVGQVTCTPTFAEKKTQGVEYTLEVLAERRIPIRIVQAGDRLLVGEGVEIKVLHPPAKGPEGSENSRSMTLRIVHEGNVILLTGDLEGEGLERVLGLLEGKVDVLMAPHHGSRRIDSEGLVKLARPWLIVSSQGTPLGKGGFPEAYLRKGLIFWTTNDCGAITIRSHATGLTAERFMDRERAAQPRK